jgi:small-conductance mechanosensitive channel
MEALIANSASDAAQNVADSLNQGSLTGWDLLAAALVAVASIPLSRFAGRIARRALGQASGASLAVAADLGRVVEWIVYLVALAIILSILGVNVGFLSVIFVFALIVGALMIKPMVENSAAGMLLLARPSFTIGDQIRSEDFRGVVEEIGARSTILRQSDGTVVHVSNNQVLSNPIVVYTSSESRKASFDIGVSLQTDLGNATSVLMAAITSADDVAAKPAPQVQAMGFTNNAITLTISYWYPSSMTSSSGVTDAVIRATKSALAKADIELAAPELAVQTTSNTPASSPAATSSGNSDESNDTGDSQDSSESDVSSSDDNTG